MNVCPSQDSLLLVSVVAGLLATRVAAPNEAEDLELEPFSGFVRGAPRSGQGCHWPVGKAGLQVRFWGWPAACSFHGGEGCARHEGPDGGAAVSGPCGAEGATGGGRTGGVDAGCRAEDDRSLSASEVGDLASEAVAAPDSVAELEAERVMAELEADLYEVPEEPGLLEAAGAWARDTALGYGQGLANTVLGAAELVNSGVNLGLEAVGIDYRFDTDLQIQPENEAQRRAQQAIMVAEVAAGGYGLVRSAPRLAGAVDDAADWARRRVEGPPPPVNAAFNGTPVGELRGPVPSRHRLESISERSVAKSRTTVAEPGVDMAGDVAAIRAGRGEIVGDRIHINGRVYGSHDGTLYPVEGAGLHQLDRGTFKALQSMRQHGVEGARPYLDNMGVSAETRDRAAALLALLR